MMAQSFDLRTEMEDEQIMDKQTTGPIFLFEIRSFSFLFFIGMLFCGSKFFFRFVAKRSLVIKFGQRRG